MKKVIREIGETVIGCVMIAVFLGAMSYAAYITYTP